jgi:uncharacterized peroxidase-related enzyme
MSYPAATSWFPPADNPLPNDVSALAARLEAELGFVPNLVRTYARRPDLLRAWYVHYRQLFEPTEALDLPAREMIAVVVSVRNRCEYCIASHSAGLRLALGDAALADRIAEDHRRAGLDERHVAMLEYALKLTDEPASCRETDLEHLRSLGFTDDELRDVIELTAMFNFTNRLTSAAGIVPNPAYQSVGRSGASRAWSGAPGDLAD